MIGRLSLVSFAVFALGCSSDPTGGPPPPPPPPPPASLSCSAVAPVQLAVGQHQVIDAAQTSGCVRVPAAGAAGAEYIVDIASTASTRSTAGVAGSYYIRTANPSATAAPQITASAAPSLRPQSHPLSAQGQFDLMLREKERALAADPRYRVAIPGAPARAAAGVPNVGDQQTFKVCDNLQCTAFVDVPATARFVGTHAAIFMDNSVPQNDTLLEVDYADLGRTFDTYHYPIDVTAFGNESDRDNNQRVIVLLTDAVNALTPDCTNGRVLGYFFGGDLLAGFPNSNNGEIFYAFVPSPATTQCPNAVTRSIAVDNIKPTLIHEFQHMISYNQHALLRGGPSEETWLNEALSHFAEELGGRLIPITECPHFSSCRSQYVSGDIFNSYDYLTDTESHFLIYPTSSTGTLEERGASWYFLRWVLDQFATDTILGTDLTQKLVRTAATGVANITTATGGDFSTMVPEWLLAAYLDDLPGFTPLSDRIKFKSWGLRGIWTNPVNQDPPLRGGFHGFPLKPDVTSGIYTHAGTLRGGSGRHLRLSQPANGAAIDVQFVKTSAGEALDPALVARIGIARIQ